MKADSSTNEEPVGVMHEPEFWSLRKEALFPAVCVISAFVIRFLLIPTDGVINGDGIYYATLGRKMMSGHLSEGISAYWSPLYSFLIGISNLFFFDLEFAGRFVSVVAGSLLIIPSYILIQKFFGRVPAYIGTILVVVHPFLVLSSVWVMTESVYTLIFTTAVLLGWFALKTGRRLTFFFTGLLFGAAYLTKPEAIGFIGLVFVLVLGRKLFRPNITFRSLTAGYLIFLTGFLIFFVPYVNFIHQKTGRWTISQKLFTNSPSGGDGGLLRLTPDGKTTLQDRVWGDVYETENARPDNSVPFVPNTEDSPRPAFDVSGLIFKTFKNLIKQFREHVRVILPVPFLFVGVIGIFKRTGRFALRELYLLSFVACTFIGYAVTVIEIRYLFPLIPILMGWVAFGGEALAGWVTKSGEFFLKTGWRINPVFVQVLILLILIVSLQPLYAINFAPPEIRNTSLIEKQAGLWLKQHSEPNSLVMAANATTAFYAEAKHVFLPDEEFSRVLEYAKRKKVKYLVLSERRLRDRPEVFLLAEKAPELNLVFQNNEFENFEVRIYRVIE